MRQTWRELRRPLDFTLIHEIERLFWKGRTMRGLHMVREALLRICAALIAIAVVAPAGAQEKTGGKPGFALQPGTVRIALMRPTVRVGEQSTGGLFEPNADWTQQARENLIRALRESQASLGNEVIEQSETAVGGDPVTAQYRNLFGVVADSVITYQFFPGNRLPTKKRKDSFDWGLGPGVANVPVLKGMDYALFINTEDHYGSTGRKALQIVGLLAGVGVTSGVHKGHAGLVDLRTGELVWLNADLQMGGDVRTPEGAAKRVRQLLEGFPGRPAQQTAAAQPVGR